MLWPRGVAPAAAGRMILPAGVFDTPRGNTYSALARGAFGNLNLKCYLLHFTPRRFSAPGLDAGLIGAAGRQMNTYTWK